MQDPNGQLLTLIGAGPVGSLLAGFLAKRGFRVRVFERRPDMRKEKIEAGRSINLAVSARALYALRELGIEEEVLKRAVPMKGRMIHAVDGALTFQRYGKDDTECINSVSRGELNELLMTHAEATGRVEFNFRKRLVSCDLEQGALLFKDEKTGADEAFQAQSVIGTDGTASVVRREILRASKADPSACSEKYLDYGYKELHIPPGPAGPAGKDGRFLLEKNALHIWPRGTYMLIALPNRDGSFTVTLFLPLEGEPGFAHLKEPRHVRALFEKQFGDVLRLIPDLESSFFQNPTGHMVTVKCSPWHYKDRALVLGDAAHAIVPFFGQGMNAGFEDCTVLDELLSGTQSLERAFSLLSSTRKADSDAIADMAVENFTEMRDKVGDPRFLLEKAVERILQREFPEDYVSRYSLVTFRREPYRLALQAGLIESQILTELCRGIEAPEAVDLKRAEILIRSKLSPLLNRKGTVNGSETQR
jgi:kynurenine 3-monooxygenase